MFLNLSVQMFLTGVDTWEVCTRPEHKLNHNCQHDFFLTNAMLVM